MQGLPLTYRYPGPAFEIFGLSDSQQRFERELHTLSSIRIRTLLLLTVHISAKSCKVQENPEPVDSTHPIDARYTAITILCGVRTALGSAHSDRKLIHR